LIQVKAVLITAILLFSTGMLDAKDYKGAELRTKQSFLYGRFEVSMKAAAREGMLSSFFTYNDFATGPDQWNEIDFEILGRYTDNVQVNTITPGQINHVRSQPVSFNPALDYHTYAFEWTPEYVAWFVDGEEFYRQTGAHISTLNRAQKIMMNIWNPSFINWVGTWNADLAPAFAFYDWVKYYTYTPGTGNYGSNNNFTFSWQDDFDFYNTTRWEKGTHTWLGNGCDFVTFNAVFQDSKMILCLTDSLNLSYIDVKPPVFIAAKAEHNKVVAYFSEELETNSAQTAANYAIVGSTVDAAVLRPDRRSVELTVSGWDFTGAKNLLVFNVKDLFNNTISPRAITIVLQTQFTYPLKFNIGGAAALGYLSDAEWSKNADYGYADGGTTLYPNNLQINGTDEDEIYRSERHGIVNYRVRIPNGVYKITLMFAENYFTSPGKRVFDVYLEKNRVVQNLDIYAQAGLNTALVKSYNGITVSEGLLNIDFGAVIDNPVISGIIIEQEPASNQEGLLNYPGEFRLDQNYPNPFNGQTNINFAVGMPGSYELNIYTMLGEKVLRQDLGYLESGEHTVPLSTNSYPSVFASGIFFYSLTGNGFSKTKKFILLN